MKATENNQADKLKINTSNSSVHIVVNGCKVKLNFLSKSEKPILNDVKRMLLNGVIKI